MQLLYTVHYFIFNKFYNKRWNWYLFCLFSLVRKKKMLLVLRLVPAIKQQFDELINGKSQTNKDQKLYLLFSQRHDQSRKFRIKLVKNRQKPLQRH